MHKKKSKTFSIATLSLAGFLVSFLRIPHFYGMSFSFLFNLLSLFTFVRRRVEFWEPIVGSGLFLFLGRVWLTELVDTNCNSNDYAYVYLECLAFFFPDTTAFRLAFAWVVARNELVTVGRFLNTTYYFLWIA
jgi:hypothetical protein